MAFNFFNSVGINIEEQDKLLKDLENIGDDIAFTESFNPINFDNKHGMFSQNYYFFVINLRKYIPKNIK